MILRPVIGWLVGACTPWKYILLGGLGGLLSVNWTYLLLSWERLCRDTGFNG